VEARGSEVTETGAGRTYLTTPAFSGTEMWHPDQSTSGVGADDVDPGEPTFLDDLDAVAAVVSRASGLDALFRSLGPPPDSLKSEAARAPQPLLGRSRR
jgi:hypothetical protein